MAKICPYSMGGEPTECYEGECMAWSDGECSKFVKEPLSEYFTAKNLRTIADAMKGMGYDDLR